ncbi:MAG: hypothetical protein C5B57_12475 [Blastocatellia bacterium]|nr:MAG: hypothetical protein C5B57_12475 [Blastocatellia bacterium]
MAFVASDSGAGATGPLTRPIVLGLFVATCLLSIVSWYTTYRGMALYLSVWFSFLASLGIQTSLVLVAWLIGFTRERRPLLIAVYGMTALVSIGFSYGSLYTWFSSQERPARVQRRLYDNLNEAVGKTETTFVEAIAEGQKHVLALEELTAAEKTLGHVSRAEDADPYLRQVREAVAKEAQTYAAVYREGAGEGVRYTAFDRYLKLARQSLERIEEGHRALTAFRTQAKPLDSSEQQLRAFGEVVDRLPWDDVEATLHGRRVQRAAVPAYADFVDRTVTNQEDLVLAFQELFTDPNSRHVFALSLAAFIDVIVFLLAFASGPHFFGTAEQRWVAAAAAVDGLDEQVFARNFISKVTAGLRGTAKVEAAALTPGERQLCLALQAKDLATASTEKDAFVFLLDLAVHERLLDLLVRPGISLRTTAVPHRAIG